MEDGRWTTVTDSEFDHERRGLEAIRRLLPNGEPWRAWSNFTFTANSGHIREVDLLVVSPNGVHLIELKDWHGAVESRNGTWLQTQPSGRQVAHGNPVHLANKKAKELAGLLAQAAGPKERRRWWISEAVCFTDRSLEVRLSPNDRHGIHDVTGLVEHISRPPRDEASRIKAGDPAQLARLLGRVGIEKSTAQYRVGPYRLDRKAFDSGPTWADYLAHHDDLREASRVRIYLRERGADQTLRDSVERAAQREAAALTGFGHPGVVRLSHYDASAHPSGPALIFEYDPHTVRLDQYLAQHGDRLDLLGRIALVRQLAETLRSAHKRRLFHRGLSARSVHVVPVRRVPDAGDETAWLTPQLQLSDWQIALRTGAGSQNGGAGLPGTRTSHLGQHLSEAADPYLAPELNVTGADPIALDVYGLGMLTYLLVTGCPPAASQAEVVARLEDGQGLRPSALRDDVPVDLDLLVDCATAYDPLRRLATIDEFLELLEDVESALTEPAPYPGAEAAAAIGPAPEASESAGTTAVELPEEERPEPAVDPLDAVAGQVLAGRWEILRRIGTGSTSRAFLVRDLNVDEEAKVRSLAVLKVALSDSRVATLRREAESMARLRPDSRVIRLVEPEPLVIGKRTALVLEYVGDERAALEGRAKQETVARQLREQGRLTIDELEAYGDYLFGAVDFLEGEGLWHRDIKPDNIAIRVRPNRTRELVLIDFSLAGHDATQTGAGTEGYLDPFVGLPPRKAYDAHAERYAIAVTLHEMASRELPVWGDGRKTPRQTDAEKFPTARVAADAFDPQIRDGLIAFFEKALHRDAAQRFPELKHMRDAWKRVFLALDTVRPSSRSKHTTTGHGVAAEGAAHDTDGTRVAALEDAEPESVGAERDDEAAKARPDTLLELAGLSPAAKSFVHALGLATVQDLLNLSRRGLVNKPGLGEKTRRELQRRMKQWRLAFAQAPAAPLGEKAREEAEAELSALEEAAARAALAVGVDPSSVSPQLLRRLSLDVLATVAVPQLNEKGSNRNAVDAVRLLLRLPDETGVLPNVPAWPRQSEIFETVGITQSRVAQIVSDERRRWAEHPAVVELRAEVIELLVGRGRVASAVELADALVARRGTQLVDPRQRRALALAVLRVAVEVDHLGKGDRTIAHLANREAADESLGAGLLGLEYREGVDAPDTPSAPGLLEYAGKLGKVADRLAGSETLPTSATVLTELGAVPAPIGTVDWDERRTVEVAAAASHRAAATPRLEIYPRNLPLVRALRITQAGVVGWIPGQPESRQPGLTVSDVHARVRARFPELSEELPKGQVLTKALAEAGFDLVLGIRDGAREPRYLPSPLDRDSTAATWQHGMSPQGTSARTTARRTATSQLYSDDPELRLKARAEQQLAGASGRDGFRVLTVRSESAHAARAVLTSVYGAEAVSAAAYFLAALHEQVDPRPRPTWETILRADVAAAGSTAAVKFGEYALTAWGVAEARLAALVRNEEAGAGGAGPLVVTEGAVFARYDAMGVLHRLAERARKGGRGLWLLCPQLDATAAPHLGTTVVPYQAGLNEWVKLNDAWVAAGQSTLAAAEHARTKTRMQSGVAQ